MPLSVDARNRLGYAMASFTAAAETADAIDTTLANGALADGKIPIGSVANVAAAQTLTGDVTVTRLGVTSIGAGKVAQAMDVAASRDATIAAVVADKNVIGGIPVVFRIDLAAGALADTDVIMTHKVRVIDAYLVLRGAGVATTTLQVKNTASAITNAMAASGSDQALVRCATIDDANYEIAAAGTLRVTSATGASQPAATVYVTALRVA